MYLYLYLYLYSRNGVGRGPFEVEHSTLEFQSGIPPSREAAPSTRNTPAPPASAANDAFAGLVVGPDPHCETRSGASGPITAVARGDLRYCSDTR